MHATTTRCKTIAFMPVFRSVLIGSVEVNDVLKTGGIQKPQVLWQAVFLAASPLVISAKTFYSARLQYRQLRRTKT